ncbi:MAG: hypothetical protein EOR60_17840 [Mesorhizobium sp.]|nr:MAG: hypothetical protein EOR60_17840 [Mesorhizobium sp.]
MDLDIQFVERHPVLEIAVEAIGLLNQDDSHAGVLAQVFDHFTEVGSSAALGGLDIDVFLDDAELLLKGVLSQELALRRNGEALFLLLFRGHARIKERLHEAAWLRGLCASPGYCPHLRTFPAKQRHTRWSLMSRRCSPERAKTSSRVRFVIIGCGWAVSTGKA